MQPSAEITDLHFGTEPVIFFYPVGVKRRGEIRSTAYQRDNVLTIRGKADAQAP